MVYDSRNYYLIIIDRLLVNLRVRLTNKCWRLLLLYSILWKNVLCINLNWGLSCCLPCLPILKHANVGLYHIKFCRKQNYCWFTFRVSACLRKADSFLVGQSLTSLCVRFRAKQIIVNVYNLSCFLTLFC